MDHKPRASAWIRQAEAVGIRGDRLQRGHAHHSRHAAAWRQSWCNSLQTATACKKQGYRVHTGPQVKPHARLQAHHTLATTSSGGSRASSRRSRNFLMMTCFAPFIFVMLQATSARCVCSRKQEEHSHLERLTSDPSAHKQSRATAKYT